ncbi:hypothetical protein DFJ74DRAFT_687656 [Hyaloraphidium curvatum]|nr:hypothetical protein DFJ74DRAFT_687656 [Hyaloraphidium curvatum]
MPDRGVLAWAGTTMNLAHRARELGAVVEWARKEFKLESIYLVGRSMGCRASAKYALEDAEMLVKGLAFLSYPLVAGGRGAAPEPADKKAKGKPGKKDDRASLLSDLARTRPDVPLLFFRGTADPMLPSAALSAALRDAFAISELDISLAACQGADHGLKVKGKGAKERSEGLEKAVVEKIVAWIAVGRVAGKGAREEELSF